MLIIDSKLEHTLTYNGAYKKTLETRFNEDIDFLLELLHAQGLEFKTKEQRYYYATALTPLEDTTFCIVDVETNGSKPEKHQIIEIGAVKVKNGEILEQFESLVQCDTISKHISEITGIKVEDTLNAPTLKEVMPKFKAFIGSDVFIGHDVKFDYSFISAMLEKVGLEPLMNRPLCTIKLAERTLTSFRYGLSFLNEHFELYKGATHHRALSDAITTAHLFHLSLQNLPIEAKTAEDLIQFSKKGKRLKRPKFPPEAKEDIEKE